MEAKCGGLAVATGAAVRWPLQPRDTSDVVASTVVVGKAAIQLPPTMVFVAGVAEALLAEELEKTRKRCVLENRLATR